MEAIIQEVNILQRLYSTDASKKDTQLSLSIFFAMPQKVATNNINNFMLLLPTV